MAGTDGELTIHVRQGSASPSEYIGFDMPPQIKPDMIGRPLKFDPIIMDRVFEQLTKGRLLESICLDTGMPAADTVRKWLGEDYRLAARWRKAVNWGFEALWDDIITIADNVEGNVARDRLRLAVRYWLISKMPRRHVPDPEAGRIDPLGRLIGQLARQGSSVVES